MNFQFILLLTVIVSLNEAGALSKYGNKTFNEWTWLTAHNSHVNWKDSRIIDALTNQLYSIEKQLDLGVRGFMLDIDWKSCSGFEKFFGACRCTGVCLCHGPCRDLVKDGFHIKNFNYALATIVKFLKANREEIVTLFLEDYINRVQILQHVFRDVDGFSDMVFNPYSAEWNVVKNGWPRIDDMVKANKRILIVDDEQRGFHAKKWPGLIRSRDFFIENHYEWINEPYEWTNFNSTNILGEYQARIIVNNTAQIEMSPCFSLHRDNSGPLWYETRALNLTEKEHKDQMVNGQKLFLFNHFRGVKALTESMNPITQMIMNKPAFVMKRLEEKCYFGTQFKKPNYIALDFIEANDYADLIDPFNF